MLIQLQSSVCIYESELGYDIKEREKQQEWTMAAIFLALSWSMGYLSCSTEHRYSHCSLVTQQSCIPWRFPFSVHVFRLCVLILYAVPLCLIYSSSCLTQSCNLKRATILIWNSVLAPNFSDNLQSIFTYKTSDQMFIFIDSYIS